MDFEYHRTGDYVEARASGTAKEIASLVLELQGKPKRLIRVNSIVPSSPEEREMLANTIRTILLEQSQGRSSKQQPDPTLPERKQDAEFHPKQPVP